MVITSVEKQKRNRDMLSVYIDNQYAFSIPEEHYITMSLYEMQEITQDTLDYIRETVNFRAAKSKAVRFLSLKVRSEKEVRDKLDSDGFDGSVIEMVAEDLKSIGYINDKIFVQKYIFDRNKLKPISKKLMKYELQKKGILESVIDEILDEWELDDFTVAEGLVKKKFGKYDLKDMAVIKKVYAFLRHRGYNMEVIEEVLGKL